MGRYRQWIVKKLAVDYIRMSLHFIPVVCPTVDPMHLAPLATNVTMSASVQCLFCQQETLLSRGEAAIEEHLLQEHSVARSRGLLTSLHLLTQEEVGELTHTLRPRLEELQQKDIQSHPLPQDEDSHAEQAESEQNEDDANEDKELADIQMLLMPSDSESDEDDDEDNGNDNTLDPENDR